VLNSHDAQVAYPRNCSGMHWKIRKFWFNQNAVAVIVIVKSLTAIPKEDVNSSHYSLFVSTRVEILVGCRMESRQETPELPPKQLTPGQQ
jgi:hypothetical protein